MTSQQRSLAGGLSCVCSLGLYALEALSLPSLDNTPVLRHDGIVRSYYLHNPFRCEYLLLLFAIGSNAAKRRASRTPALFIKPQTRAVCGSAALRL